MKKSILIAGAAMIGIAIPAIAAHHGGPDGGPGMMMKDMTRADMQTMVKDHFAQVDANKDGAVTQDEMKAYRETRRAERMDERFKMMDSNSDGSISREEFDAAHQAMHDGMGPHGPMAMGDDDARPMHGKHGRGHDGMMKMSGHMFKKADANNDGKVTLSEATTAALAHFDKVDTDKNGTVTASEKMEYWKTKKAEWMSKKAEKTS